MYNIIELIDKKRNKKTLSSDEINWIITNYLDQNIADYQMSALLMAICINGLNQDEINDLTTAFINSGEVIDLSMLKKPTVDKHSTGGVGDKTSLIIAPILACFGVDVAKMSGRGLGFTGGTLDKLEAIKGFNINLSTDQFINQVNEIGLSIIAQSQNLVPADKKIYALRDVCGCVDSIGLIAASIMSKKIASGADNIILDIKCGSGAFMKNEQQAKELANCLINIAKAHNKNVCALITSMQQPLGIGVGNSIEVLEVIDVLQAKGPNDLLTVSIALVKNLVELAGIIVSEQEILEKITSNQAYEKFEEFVVAQGGSKNALKNLKVADNVYHYQAKQSGYISQYQTDLIGLAAQVIGAGRRQKTDQIDYEVGLKIYHKIGDQVNKNDVLVDVYYNDKEKLEQAINYLDRAIFINDKQPESIPLIYEIVK